MPDLWAHLQGPVGGLVAMFFGFGAAAGYGFAMRTALAAARERIKSEVEEKLMWRDKYLALKD